MNKRSEESDKKKIKVRTALRAGYAEVQAEPAVVEG